MRPDDAGDDAGGLRVLATADSEPEADVMRQRLTAVGIPSVAQRTIGGPEWGFSGARYVYVPAAELDRAREVLGLPLPPEDVS
jgi:hypothetical protein